MFNPNSTYRIQFNHQFTFNDFDRIIPYLQKLGIKTVYASPILEAIPGSMHGYDTVNPHQINPEIGTLEELKAVAKKLKDAGIQWIQDIVPNHMAFHPSNQWLMDVLEKGKDSAYYSFFDINWAGDPATPLMVPFLGSTLEEAIEQGELKLVKQEDKLFLKYQQTQWPVNKTVKTISMPIQEAVEAQYYRLCHWEETNHQINFRRFFTVNSLICLNIQNKETFTAYHQLISTLLQEGIFQGLRVDHIDGLYDPQAYLNELRNLAGEDVYIVVEKILEKGEEFPAEWPVQGNTGYDFLSLTNNLITYKKAKKYFSKYNQQLTTDRSSVKAQITAKKTDILTDYMAGELDNLYHLFLELDLLPADEIKALPANSLKEAIAWLLIHCPVYRFYGQQLPLSDAEGKGMKKLLKKLSKVKPLQEAAKLLTAVLIHRPAQQDTAYALRATQFYLRLMQFSGPLMAKGVEDTLMYTYNRFIGHNEVGDAPNAFGIGRKVFHNQMWIRQKKWPLTLNASATHDTKRGEDFRARLAVLSSLPNEWIQNVKEWKRLNQDISSSLSADDEYFIYQTLIGSYPMPDQPEEEYKDRLCAYLEKALREGKRNSNWAHPNESYEHSVKEFALGLLEPSSDFNRSFKVLHTKTADFGILNSLSQLVLKFSCPGIPDTYQGTELWDLSMVDPDNRRPVDYQQREHWLNQFIQEDRAASVADCWAERYTGKIKLLLLHKLLQYRESNPDLFTSGEYIPLEVKGTYSANLFAFARKQDLKWLITIVPLHLPLLAEHAEAILNLDWENTRVILPANAALKWENLLTAEKGNADELSLFANEVFATFPLGLLEMKQTGNSRAAGVLLPITSLPSSYGIGDMGPQARKFADFLALSGQQYWQLLPLNPIGEEQAFSPYSSISSMAGNTLLISMELLEVQGLLTKKELKDSQLDHNGQANFKKVISIKDKLLSKAYKRFKQSADSISQKQFTDFCAKEHHWLQDFALYIVIKQAHENQAWYQWEQDYKLRDAKTLAHFAVENQQRMLRVKWDQFIFFTQWTALKTYVNAAGIRFYGDLPFYVGHDSADVWANTELFDVNNKGDLNGVAGVPPDYFNADGQLWGMPVYNWEKLKAQNYRWWLQRIHKNMELYDLLRLDHFRAFCDYWEVPAGSVNAINGIWKTGPGADFFSVLQREFPQLPFIAEDLGEINEEVYTLRDEFKLMGMKVLQFAFGKDIDVSEHIPSRYSSTNFVVYTGTHDNDTTVGWYANEAGHTEQKNLTDYAGYKVTAKNVHRVLAQLAYSSVARLAILPMQDILGLDGATRMNKPASTAGNWAWRLKKIPGKSIQKKLRRLATVYGRL